MEGWRLMSPSPFMSKCWRVQGCSCLMQVITVAVSPSVSWNVQKMLFHKSLSHLLALTLSLSPLLQCTLLLISMHCIDSLCRTEHYSYLFYAFWLDVSLCINRHPLLSWGFPLKAESYINLWRQRQILRDSLILWQFSKPMIIGYSLWLMNSPSIDFLPRLQYHKWIQLNIDLLDP